ncbi:hypothetical protein N7490_011607 [Penicillium lividum]|nr:hypothetical protein N7490_011607 [Penicillium lividum]
MNIPNNSFETLSTQLGDEEAIKILAGSRVPPSLPVPTLPSSQTASFQSQGFHPTSAQAVPQYGGSGGTPFLIHPSIPSPIKTLEVYCGISDDPARPYVIRGLRVSWYIGPVSPLYGCETDRKSTYNFQPEERVVSMTIAGGVRLDSIDFTTTIGKFRAGGDGGMTYGLDVGSGVIVGWQGRAGWDIDALGVAFFAGEP